MTEKTYLKLQYSENSVANMASRILSAYIATGKLTETNEEELITKATLLAIKLAQKADKFIDSDDESTE